MRINTRAACFARLCFSTDLIVHDFVVADEADEAAAARLGLGLQLREPQRDGDLKATRVGYNRYNPSERGNERDDSIMGVIMQRARTV